MLSDELLPVGERYLVVGFQAALQIEAAETGGEWVIGGKNGASFVGRGKMDFGRGCEPYRCARIGAKRGKR